MRLICSTCLKLNFPREKANQQPHGVNGGRAEYALARAAKAAESLASLRFTIKTKVFANFV